ncbi:MAG: UDP-N-acetylglucosamine 2-epimerase (hydrolyzing) [Candidatus Riflebacteria bacterium]|nr:UDP-N-acetylglucosamine 2-epimerase (hydrolyzing) [Candidatus Riflebacteria bacterium]
MKARKVCVVTGSRADFGLLLWIMKEIQATPGLALQVVVTGTHPVPGFGDILADLDREGIPVSGQVDMLLANDSPVAIAKAIGLGTIGFADLLDRLRPDILLVLGDRYEILAAAQAALVARLPIAHVHGGESTEGAIDEAIRHSLTKMSHLHFVAAESFRRRVIQLGEDPRRVWTVGAPGLETIRRAPRVSRRTLERDLEFSLADPLFLVTWHPETLGADDFRDGVRQLCEALDRFPAARILWTRPNSDTHASFIVHEIEAFGKERPGRAKVVASLGTDRYAGLLRLAAVVIGNSSSGIIEAPFLKVPTVNIGTRQNGRPRAPSIIDCPVQAEAIAAAIVRALSPRFRAACRHAVSPYGVGHTARRIAGILREVPLDGVLVKHFYDLPARRLAEGKKR